MGRTRSPGRGGSCAALPPGRADAVGPDRPPFLGGLVGFLGYDLGRAARAAPAPGGRRSGPAARCGSGCTTGSSPGTVGRVGPGWPGGRSTATPAPSTAAWPTCGARLEERLLGPVPGAPSGVAARAGLHVVARSACLPRRGRGGPRGHRPRRHLPGQPDPPPRGAASAATRGRSIAVCGPATRRSSPPTSTSAPARRARRGRSSPHRRSRSSPPPRTASSRADPIKGTRPRGRDRATDRALAAELLASAKDRAENVMIVDVLRNDLGRVCLPGSVRVPRLCRLERTAAVQHLVSTVTGRLRPGRDAFDLLAASFPGGSITGAPKLRAIEILEDLEPVRRGPYTGALGWIGPDGAMGTSILIRTLRRRRRAPDPPRRRRHHLAQRRRRRMGRDGRQGARPARRDRRPRDRLGSRPRRSVLEGAVDRGHDGVRQALLAAPAVRQQGDDEPDRRVDPEPAAGRAQVPDLAGRAGHPPVGPADRPAQAVGGAPRRIARLEEAGGVLAAPSARRTAGRGRARRPACRRAASPGRTGRGRRPCSRARRPGAGARRTRPPSGRRWRHRRSPPRCARTGGPADRVGSRWRSCRAGRAAGPRASAA